MPGHLLEVLRVYAQFLCISWPCCIILHIKMNVNIRERV